MYWYWRFGVTMYQTRLRRHCVYLPLLQCIASAFHRSTALDTRSRDVFHPLRSFAVLHQSRRVQSTALLPWQLFLSRRGHWRVKRTEFLKATKVNIVPSLVVTGCPFSNVHISCSPLSKVLRRAPPSSCLFMRLNGVTRPVCFPYSQTGQQHTFNRLYCSPLVFWEIKPQKMLRFIIRFVV